MREMAENVLPECLCGDKRWSYVFEDSHPHIRGRLSCKECSVTGLIVSGYGCGPVVLLGATDRAQRALERYATGPLLTAWRKADELWHKANGVLHPEGATQRLHPKLPKLPQGVKAFEKFEYGWVATIQETKPAEEKPPKKEKPSKVEEDLYDVFHWDTFDNTTLPVGNSFPTKEAAENFIHERYGARISTSGADVVDIVERRSGTVVGTYHIQ